MNDRNDIAQFYISTDEDLRFRLTFANRGFTGRTLAIIIRERETNELKTTLTAPSRITISSTGPIPGVTPDPPASNDIVAALPKSLMAGWATGDYEADLLDVTVGSATRICPVRFTYDQPGRLVHGVEGNQATIYVNDENQAIVTAVGGVGVPGPANTLAAGTIEMLAPSADPEITITGDAPNQTLNLKIPRGLTGLTGPSGQIISVDATTLAPGAAATVTNEGTTTAAELVFGIPRGVQGDIGDTGDKGWSPVFAVASDGARRVLQVVDWVGGEGTKPATGSYVGSSGLVGTIGSAVDIRGPAGTAAIPDGDKGDITTSTGGSVWTIDNNVVDMSKIQAVATGVFLGRRTAGTGNVEVMTVAQATALLNAAVGANGTVAGTKGLVPQPGATDNTKFLRGDMTFADPPGGGGGFFQGERGDIGLTAAKGDIFRVAEQQLDTNVTIAAGDNAVAPGPLTIASGITLTVSTGANLVIV